MSERRATPDDGEQPRKVKTRVPPVLHYTYPRIGTLEETIYDVCRQSGIRELPQLTQSGDAPEYDWLLHRTFASVQPRAPKLPLSTSFQQLSSLDEVLARALSQLLKAHSSPHNVLCYGVRRRRDPDSRRGGGGIFGGGGANIYNDRRGVPFRDAAGDDDDVDVVAANTGNPTAGGSGRSVGVDAQGTARAALDFEVVWRSSAVEAGRVTGGVGRDGTHLVAPKIRGRIRWR